MTDPPPVQSTISTPLRRRGKLGMTYSNEQVGLELRDTLRGLPDKFMDLIVGGSHVRLILCHLPRGLIESTIGARDKDRNV